MYKVRTMKLVDGTRQLGYDTPQGWVGIGNLYPGKFVPKGWVCDAAPGWFQTIAQWKAYFQARLDLIPTQTEAVTQ